MNYKPKISVITAVYNGGKHIEKSIRSVVEQTYPAIEYIVIDGGSTDDTVEKIKKYEEQINFWISEKDAGVYDAWNKALSLATGEWITFLGSDDYFPDAKTVENIIGDLSRALKEQIPFVYGKVNLLSTSGSIINILGNPWEESKKDIFSRMSLPHCASFHHNSLFLKYGIFNSKFRICGDYELLLRAFSHGKNALFTDKVHANMLAGGLSANLRSRLIVVKEDILARELNHLPPLTIHKFQLLKARLSLLLLKTLGTKYTSRMLDMLRSLTGKEKLWSR